MNLLHGVGDFFSLDIGTNSMRIVQLSGNSQRGWTLQKYAYVPLDQQLMSDKVKGIYYISQAEYELIKDKDPLAYYVIIDQDFFRYTFENCF